VGRTINILLAFFIAIFLFSMFMIFAGSKITGYAASGSTVSNVTVEKSFSITLSGNLTQGIFFGNISTLDNANATDNYITNEGNFTKYFTNVSTDATIDVDFCLNANGDMLNPAGDIIGLSNETYSNATTTSATVPDLANQVSFTTSGVKAGEDVGPGIAVYYRFWLNITSNVPSGTYNNSITFTGKERGAAC